MSGSPAFQYYPADMATDPIVQFWDMEQLGCYHQLIDYLWLNSGRCPEDLGLISKLFRVSRRDKAEKMWRKVKVKFEIIDGIITHRRVMKEMQRQEEQRLKQSDGGKKGMESRWKKHKIVTNKLISPHLITSDNSSSSSSSSSSLHNPPTPRDDFEDFWQHYPRKVGKEKCREWFAKHRPSAELVGTMIAAVERQKKWPQWQKEGGQFVPHPATWLNQGRWDDEPAEVAGTAKPNSQKSAAELYAEGQAKDAARRNTQVH